MTDVESPDTHAIHSKETKVEITDNDNVSRLSRSYVGKEYISHLKKLQKAKNIRQRGFEQRFSLMGRPKFDDHKSIQDRRCSRSPSVHSSYGRRASNKSTCVNYIDTDMQAAIDARKPKTRQNFF